MDADAKKKAVGLECVCVCVYVKCVCLCLCVCETAWTTAAPARSTTRAASAAALAWRSLREKPRSGRPRRRSGRRSQGLEGLCAGKPSVCAIGEDRATPCTGPGAVQHALVGPLKEGLLWDGGVRTVVQSFRVLGCPTYVSPQSQALSPPQ